MNTLFHISERINRYHLTDFSEINKQVCFKLFVKSASIFY